MADRFKRAFKLDRRSRGGVRTDVSDELGHHLELVTEELVEAGWDRAEAEREALRRFGDLEETRTYCEQMQTKRGRVERRREVMSFDEMVQDVRYALRSIRKAPGYAGLVVLTLAFGIAANTTIFSVMNPYLFRALPFGAPEGLVQVNQVNPRTGWDMDRFSYPQYEDWMARSRAFSATGIYVYGALNVTDREGPEQIQYASVSANMFDVLQAPATLGRTFRPEEGRPGGAQVVVLSDGLWRRRYGADPAVLGRAITLDGVQHTVIGIMPEDFNFPFGGVKLWVPVQEDAASADRNWNGYQIVGRLADGWTVDRVHDELTGIQAELSVQYPDIDGRMSGVTVKPIREALNFVWDEINILFRVLLGAVGFVLLIACANVASLTLARGSGRTREVSVRAALGARRGRIVRQLLTESLVLAMCGGALGIGLAYGITGFLDPLIPEDLYKIGSIDIDPTVLTFSLVVTLLTPIAFGLVPALAASKTSLSLGLREGSKSSGGVSTSRGRSALVVAQVALAVTLIVGAGLMLRSFLAVQTIDLGLDANRIASVEVVLGGDAYPTPEERRLFMADAVSAAASTPGVVKASAVRWLPLNHETIQSQVAPAGMAGAPDEWPLATSNFVLPGYFETMGIALLEGRDFATLDATDAQPVVVVNRTLADRLWPQVSALGRTLLVGNPENPVDATVVGVVEPVQHADLDPASVGLQIYRPSLQADAQRFFVVARTGGEPGAVVSGLRTALAGVAPDLPLTIRPMPQVVAENQMQWSLSSLFLAIFGGGALLLATLGIYGLISFSVAQRQRELGVRIALGATRAEIRRSVVGGGLRLTGIGLAIGLVAALGVGQLISSLLYGVDPIDPVTLGSVMTLFLGVAALASFVPAARASGADPISVLRSE